MSDEYRPGDIVNGHVLGTDLQWHPLQQEPDDPAAQTQVLGASGTGGPETQVLPGVTGGAPDDDAPYPGPGYGGDGHGSDGNEPPGPRGRQLGLLMGGVVAILVVVVAIVAYASGRDSTPAASPSSSTSTPATTGEAAPTTSPSPSAGNSSSAAEEPSEPAVTPTDNLAQDITVGGRRADDLEVRSLVGRRNVVGLFSTILRVRNTSEKDHDVVTVKVVALRGEEVVATANGLIASITAGQTVTTRPISTDQFPRSTEGISYEITLD